MRLFVRILMFLFFNLGAILNIANSVKEFKKDHYYIGGFCMSCALVLIYSSVEMMIMMG